MIKGNLLVFILLVQTTCTVFGQEFKCPFTDYLNGCKCYPKSKSIVCEDKSGPPKLNVTESPGIHYLKKLELNGTQWDTSKLDLTGINIETLVLINIKKFELTNGSPLVNLQISGENIEDLFKTMKQKMNGTLTINVPTLKPIDTNIFKHIDGAKEIILQHISLETIGTEFLKFTDLTYLDLSHNNIKKFDTNCFNFSGSQPIIIDLGYNKLTEEQLSNIFETEANLAIDLSNNDIRGLKTFKEILNKSISVHLMNNPINCVDLGWIFDHVNAYKAKLNQVQCKNYGYSDLFSLEDKLKHKSTTEQTTHPTATVSVTHQTTVTKVNDTTATETTVTTNATTTTTNATTIASTTTRGSFWDWFKLNF